ncbi:MAG TPA: adenylate/guanylate cyclase domain-containing protein [Methylomirabilota bacterium]|nr:adenylate/guanylate cyclase domain-containing protein [Methylomirabilota bacterium]
MGEPSVPAGAAAGTGAPPAAAAAAGTRFASPHAYTPAHLAERILKERSALAGERKQVTVLFADVSGFTSISERLDPEDVHALINRAFELMLAEIHRYEGTVNQFLGDGLMALFGAPVAHEDHAQRAAHAALAMQATLARYREELARTRRIDFRMRMGLNTGLVVVGAIGDNLRMDYTAVGDTTNTAARMQQLAEPGQVVVADATERPIAPYFELRALGTFSVKNRAQAVAAWELIRARPHVSRLTARAAHGLSPFVGRDDTVATLERALAAARSGRGQVALIVGEAGIGKSRLLLEFRRRAGDVTWLQADCISFGQSIPFLPIVDVVKQRFGIEDADDEARMVERVRAGLRTATAAVEPYVRLLLALDPGDPTVAAMDPAQRRVRLVGAIQQLLAADSRERPLVLVIEDAHWIDRASDELLVSLADVAPGMPILLVVTYRPVYQQPFGDRTYHWRIALRPVDADDAVQIVRSTLGVPELPAELAARIADKAEGNPFFLEELGRALVESGGVRAEGDRLVLAATAATLIVPETVQDVIAARLDRLEEPAKRTVQTASVIGREFALDLLRRVSDLHNDLERSLTELKRIELIYEKTALVDLEYVFRHALTQDVAYASLLQAERRRLHGMIGAALEELHAGRLEGRTEELVYHFRRGEVWDKVARYARDAAERAAALCADDKAVEYYEAVLEALRHLPETPEHARTGTDVRLAMRAPLWRGGQPDRLFQLYKDAEALAARHGFGDVLDTIYAYFVQHHWAKGEHDVAIEYGTRCLERAAARDDLALRVTGLLYMGHARIGQGRFAEAVGHYREIMSLLEGPRATERFGLSGQPYCSAAANAAEALCELGDVAGGFAMLERGRAAADASGHLYSQMTVAAYQGAALVHVGRLDEAIPLLEATAATCREKKFVGQLINASRFLARAYIHSDRPEDAVRAIQESIALHEAAGVLVVRATQLTTLGLAQLALGDREAARRTVNEAIAFAVRQGEHWCEGWARLALAEVEAADGEHGAAAAELDQAQDIAEEHGMRPLVERCRRLARRLR